MVKSGLVSRTGSARALLWILALAVLTLGVASGCANLPATTEVTNGEHTVRVIVPQSGPGVVVVNIEQPPVLSLDKAAEPPKGMINVGNIQVFEGPDRIEKTDFSKGNMRIMFQNASGKKIITFGILDKGAGKWILWNPGGSNPDLEKMGFKGDFKPGNPAVLTVVQWPAGDPCICR